MSTLRVVKNWSPARKMDMRTSNPQANATYLMMPHWDIVDESGKVVSGGITDGYFKSDRPRFATKKAALEALARRLAATGSAQ